MRLKSTILTTVLALTSIWASPILPPTEHVSSNTNTHLSHLSQIPTSHPPQTSLDKRQWQVIIVDILSILGIIKTVVNLIDDIEELEHQHAREAYFTQTTVSQLRAAYPTMNVIVYHDQNSITHFHGGNHTHYELKIGTVPIIGIDLTKGYEVWVIDHGTFERRGDGGFINWCYDGDFDADGADVTFYSMNEKVKV